MLYFWPRQEWYLRIQREWIISVVWTISGTPPEESVGNGMEEIEWWNLVGESTLLCGLQYFWFMEHCLEVGFLYNQPCHKSLFIYYWRGHSWGIFWHSYTLGNLFHGNIFQLRFLTYLYELLIFFSFSCVGIYCHSGRAFSPLFWL